MSSTGKDLVFESDHLLRSSCRKLGKRPMADVCHMFPRQEPDVPREPSQGLRRRKLKKHAEVRQWLDAQVKLVLIKLNELVRLEARDEAACRTKDEEVASRSDQSSS